MDTRSYYDINAYLARATPTHRDGQDSKYQEFLDYLSQPHWFDKVLREVRKEKAEAGNGYCTRLSER